MRTSDSLVQLSVATKGVAYCDSQIASSSPRISRYSALNRRRPCRNDAEPVYAFIPVVKGKVAGFVIVRKRVAFAFARRCRKFVPIESNPQLHWCIERIWIYETYRRKGFASTTVRSIAQYFQEDTANIGWLTPFSNAGFSLVYSLSRETVYLSASQK